MIDDTALMHGDDWHGQDIAGWLATEKLDGCRAYWDGAALWSRGGHAVKAPAELFAELPAGVPLDGELYGGIGTRAKIAAGMRTGRYACPVAFQVFDAPQAKGDILARLHFAGRRGASVIPARQVFGIAEARALLRTVQQRGGEGLMLHQRGQTYTPGRVEYLLKLKD